MCSQNAAGDVANVKSSWKLNDFENFKYLGSGSYGHVELAREKKSKRTIALKSIHKQKLNSPQSRTELKRELVLQHHLKHEHIVDLYGFFFDSTTVYMVLEACDSDLSKILEKLPGGLSVDRSSYIVDCIGAALHYCHQRHIIHRDVKPANILITGSWKPKLADFGSSVRCRGKNRKTFCGTLLFLSPEQLNSTTYNYKVDTWCLGILFYTVLVGHSLFISQVHEKTFMRIRQGKVPFSANVPRWASRLIRQLLMVDVTKRLEIPAFRADKALQHQIENFHKRSICH